MKNSYYDRVKDFFLVYSWSKRWNRFICVYKCDSEEEAREACKTRKKRKRQ